MKKVVQKNKRGRRRGSWIGRKERRGRALRTVNLVRSQTNRSYFYFLFSHPSLSLLNLTHNCEENNISHIIKPLQTHRITQVANETDRP